jgi:hypothetical protein
MVSMKFFLRVFPIVWSMGKIYGTDELWPDSDSVSSLHCKHIPQLFMLVYACF